MGSRLPPMQPPTTAASKFAIAALLAGAFAAAPASADSVKVSGFYRVYLSGITIGKAGFDADIDDANYAITGWGKLSGAIKMYSNAVGTAKSAGVIDGVRIVPARYDFDMKDSKESSKVNIRFTNGTVSSVSLAPPEPFRPDRVPLEEIHKTGVTDPLSTMLVPHPEGETGQALCSKSAAVFEGLQRFNIPLVYKRSVKVVSEDGSYKGTAHICSARYRPVAGHRPQRWVIRYMMENKDLEVWLTRAGNTAYAVPWRISIMTTIGPATIEAESFRVTGG
ncbi:MAG: DUF3108 domain-containing protein [Hyphomicrobiales bacterium]|nr:DUF3108 domain-containing protein [Hyphomicrobiales bacterium]